MKNKPLPNPYPLSLHSSGLYVFETDNKLIYSCGFNNVTSILSPVIGVYDLEVYDFEFDNYNPTGITIVGGKFDDRVSDTIQHLIRQFFTEQNRVLIYACDNGDGRAKQRQTLFRQWHHNLDDVINQEDVVVNLETPENLIQAYGCVLTRKDFEYKDIINRELIDKAGEIIVEKFNP